MGARGQDKAGCDGLEPETFMMIKPGKRVSFAPAHCYQIPIVAYAAAHTDSFTPASLLARLFVLVFASLFPVLFAQLVSVHCFAWNLLAQKRCNAFGVNAALLYCVLDM